MKEQPGQHSTGNKIAITSLGVCIISLVVYTNVINTSSIAFFGGATGAALVAGIISLGLSLVARKRGGRNFWVTLSMVVSLGYLFCMGIIILSLFVYWL